MFELFNENYNEFSIEHINYKESCEKFTKIENFSQNIKFLENHSYSINSSSFKDKICEDFEKDDQIIKKFRENLKIDSFLLDESLPKNEKKSSKISNILKYN